MQAPSNPNYHGSDASARGEPRGVVVRGDDGEASLTATVIALAIAVTAIGVLVGPRVAHEFNVRRVNRTVEMLGTIRRAVVAPEGFVATVGTSPGNISELIHPVWNAESGAPPYPTNGCGRAFSSRQVSRWDHAGPFLPFAVDARGIETPVGVITDTLMRISRGALASDLAVVVSDVSRSDAALLDEALDGGDGRAAGSVRWNEDADASVYYRLPIANVC